MNIGEPLRDHRGQAPVDPPVLETLCSGNVRGVITRTWRGPFQDACEVLDPTRTRGLHGDCRAGATGLHERERTLPDRCLR